MNVDDPLLTISLTYYNEPKYLKEWVDQQLMWKQLGMPIHLQIVDDGSQITPASEIIKDGVTNTSLYRVTEDLGFNSHGCRNLAMKVAPTSWVLLSDIDMIYHLSSLDNILSDIENCRISRDSYYKFKFTNANLPPINDFLVHNDTFWKTGGYDEEFVGLHFGDRIFLSNLDQFAVESNNRYFARSMRGGRRWETVPGLLKTEYPDGLILHPESFLDDISLTNSITDMISSRNKSAKGRSNKKVIQFEWERLI